MHRGWVLVTPSNNFAVKALPLPLGVRKSLLWVLMFDIGFRGNYQAMYASKWNKRLWSAVFRADLKKWISRWLYFLRNCCLLKFSVISNGIWTHEPFEPWCSAFTRVNLLGTCVPAKGMIKRGMLVKRVCLASQRSWLQIPLKTPEIFEVRISEIRLNCPVSGRINSSMYASIAEKKTA